MKKEYCYVICMIVILSIVSGCKLIDGLIQGEPAPQRNFEEKDLLYDPSLMPANWILSDFDYYYDAGEGEENSAYMNFQADTTDYSMRGGEHIYRYASEYKAARAYGIFLETYWRLDPIPEMNAGLDFSSSLADQWRFECGQSTIFPVIRCKYLAQYDEFLIDFSMAVEYAGKNYITLENVVTIVKAIDDKMAQYLIP